MSAFNEQVGGEHYKGCAIQPAEYNIRNRLGFIEGSVVKLVTRWELKGGIEDLEKARHLLALLIELKRKSPPVIHNSIGNPLGGGSSPK